MTHAHSRSSIVYIFFSLILILSPLRAGAVNQIDMYLEGGCNEAGRMETLAGLENGGLLTVELILKTANQKLAGVGAETEVRKRLRGLLAFAARIAEEHRDDHDSDLKRVINSQLTLLLARFHSRGSEQNAIISIYDSLGLWSADEFWFFLQYAKNSALLLEHHRRIQFLIPYLSQIQTDEFASRVRAIRAHNLVQLGILLDTGLMTEAELKRLFQLAAARFAERLSQGSDKPMQTPALKRQEDHAFVPVLAKLVAAIKAGNPAVISAFSKARESVRRTRNASERELRLRFFNLLASNQLDWIDTSGWMAGPTVQNVLAEHEVDDNVVLREFKVRPNCEHILKK